MGTQLWNGYIALEQAHDALDQFSKQASNAEQCRPRRQVSTEKVTINGFDLQFEEQQGQKKIPRPVSLSILNSFTEATALSRDIEILYQLSK
jgi:hypothetical protein